MSNEISIYIAGYAVLISTIALIWNIINAILSRTAKLRIDFTVVQQMTIDPIQGAGNPIPFFDIKITNVGARTRYIKTPLFVFNKTKEGNTLKGRKFHVFDQNNPTGYPLELVIGKEHNYKVNIINFLENFKDQLKINEKIWIEVIDTHNKRYRSNKIRMKAVSDAINFAYSP